MLRPMSEAAEAAPTPDLQPPREGASVPRRVWSAAGLQSAARVFGSACTAVSLMVLARSLEPGEFGRYTFWSAVFHLLDALTDCGSGALVVQRAAGSPAELGSLLRAGRGLRLRLALVGMALASAALFGFAEAGALWILFALAYEATHALELSTVVFRLRIAWGRPAAIRAATSALRLVFLCSLAAGGVAGAAPYVFVTALGSALGNFALHFAARSGLPRTDPPPAPTPGLLRLALPLGLAALCQQLYFWIDVVWVRALCGDRELGHYNAAVRLLSFLMMGAQYASLAALPWLTRRARAGELAPALRRLLLPTGLLGLAIAALVWPYAAPLLELIYGARGDYADAAWSLRWLCIALVCVHLGAPLCTALVARGDARALLRVCAVALGLNLLGNAIWVPLAGHLGAAATTALTELVVVAGAASALARGAPRQ